MLEINRLKPMVENYDPEKFSRLLNRTENLRKKLCSQIDHRRFGMDQEEINSWFVVKFIYAYNKYCQQYNEETLLGHLIRAMQFMKCRILRAAYQPKFAQIKVEYNPDHVNEEILNPYDEEAKDALYNASCKFLQEVLTDNAYMLLQLQLHPPMYVLSKMKDRGLENIHKIPDEIICNYYNLGFDDRSIKYLKSLREEIAHGVIKARQHFAKN